MCDSREAAVEADVSVAVSVAGRRSHLELLFCIRKHGLVWRRFEEAFGYVGCDATRPTLQVSVWLDDLFHLYGGQRSASCALDLFDEYSVVDPERQLGSTSHKRRIEASSLTGRRRPPSLSSRQTRSSSSSAV